MPTITRVKAAQQRYETVPVLDAQGEPVQVQVKNADGSPKTDKRGHLVFMTRTVPDKTKPKPAEDCGRCGKAIEVGSPYKHMSPKSGPYGGTRLVRCEACPDWQVWEYSNSLSARLSEISYYFWENIAEVTNADDVTDALANAAQAVTDIAEEKRESAQNIEDGFQHSTYQSDELNQQADDLEAWAQEIENADVPSAPEATWEGDTEVPPTDEQFEEWRVEVQEACSLVDDSPV
jgi:hypothetical protein